MGVEFIPCAICEDVRNDCEWYTHCSKCEETFFDCCYPEQEKKYGTVKSKKDKEYWGDEALLECDLCSKSNKENRVRELQEKLKAELES